MPTTCLICCQESQYFLLPPCNHKQMCWKCCVTLIEGSTFSCPYCKGTPDGTSCILFVNEEQMNQFTFQEVLKRSPFKSSTKSYQFYSNKDVANFIQQSTSNYCRLCYEVCSTLSLLKKHLNQIHHKQYCDVCLQSRKCLFSQQCLYSAAEITIHLKKGQVSEEGQLMLYHPLCIFCKIRYYDVDAFKAHIRMSSHLRCHVCDQNFPKQKNVYYRDCIQIEEHFIKSHYVCQFGSCLYKKLQNVYVSEQMLEQHKNRVHNQNNKHGNKTVKPVTNLILFNAYKEEQFQCDKIGKDFTKQLQTSQKYYTLVNQQHHDDIIDIRQFYRQLIKDSQKMTLQHIRNALLEQFQKSTPRTQQIHFNSVPLFCPLQMSSLNKIELQKFIRSIYQPKFSDYLIETFFTKKFCFNSTQEYLTEIQALIKSYQPISYYYLFPQFIRFMKDTNPAKQQMDQFYAVSLRELKINRIFIFHKMQRYSDILNILHQQIEIYIYNQMLNQKINIQIYQTYLKDLNPNYYQTHHASIFYVQRQKMKNMYHMVEKTKTRELLKLNWLLKLGLSNDSYKLIYDKFYYKTIDDCGQAIKSITLQQMALIYAYIDICLQVLIDKKTFTEHKSNPPTLFLSSIFSKIKTCIGTKQLTILKNIQNKSIQIAIQLNSYNRHIKKIVVNEQDHPSLLSQQFQNPKKQPNNLILFGTQWHPSNKNNINIKVNKKTINKKQEEEDFPQLFAPKKKIQITLTKQLEQFPVFNFNQKIAITNYQNHNKKSGKKKKGKDDEEIYSSNVEQLDLFNKKNLLQSEKAIQENDKKLSNPGEIIKIETKPITTKEQIKKSSKWLKIPKNFSDDLQDEIQNNSLSQPNQKQIKNQNGCRTQTEPIPKYQQQYDSSTLIKKEQLDKDDNKKKKKKSKKQQIQQPSLTTKTESQIKQPSPQPPKPKKKHKQRLDMTSSSEQQRRKYQQIQKQRQEKFKKFNDEQKYREVLRNQDEFQSLLTTSSKGSPSIINALISQSRRVEIKQTEKRVRKNKKGKLIITQKIDLSQLQS